MAVIEEVPGLVVTIDVAGEDLAEYNSDEEEPQSRTSHTYIQAESGADFSIATRYDAATFPHPQETIRYELFLDGNSIAAWTNSPARIALPGRYLTSEGRHDMGDRYVWHKFSFAELTIGTITKFAIPFGAAEANFVHAAEGDADKKLWGKLNALGTITVKFWRVRFEAVPEPPSPVPGPQPRRRGGRRGRGRGRWRMPAPQPTPPFREPDASIKPLLENDQVPEKNLKGRAVSHQAK